MQPSSTNEPISTTDTSSAAGGRGSVPAIFKDAAATGLMLLSLFSFEAKKEAQAETAPPARPVAGQSFDLAMLSMPAGFAERHAAPRVEIPAGVDRIAPSAQAEEWMKFQTELAANSIRGEGSPRLVDGSKFITPAAQAALGRFAGQRGDGITFKSVDESGYKFAFVLDSGEKWYVTEAPYYRDQFPRGIPFSEAALEIWKAGSEKLTQKEFSAPSVFSTRTGRVNFDAAKAVFKAAEESRESEKEDKAGVRKYELTSRPMGYIGMADGNQNDPIMDGLIRDTKMLPQMLNSLKGPDGEPLYNLVSRDGSDFIKVTSSPKEILRSNIKAMHDKGIRDFYLNFAGHGNEHGIFFSNGFSSQRLSPMDLHMVFTEFKDCKFVVDTVACYGGGMAEAMKAYRDPSGDEGRIFMKLQAKPYSYNQEGRLLGEEGLNGAPKVHSSYYQIFNAHFLMQGKSFGEAHYLADLASKPLIPCDAEGWLSSPTGGRQTAKADRPEGGREVAK